MVSAFAISVRAPAPECLRASFFGKSVLGAGPRTSSAFDSSAVSGYCCSYSMIMSEAFSLGPSCRSSYCAGCASLPLDEVLYLRVAPLAIDTALHDSVELILFLRDAVLRSLDDGAWWFRCPLKGILSRGHFTKCAINTTGWIRHGCGSPTCMRGSTHCRTMGSRSRLVSIGMNTKNYLLATSRLRVWLHANLSYQSAGVMVIQRFGTYGDCVDKWRVSSV